MMSNKDHEKYISYFKDLSSLITVDIPNQPNSISGKELKEKFNNIKNINYSDSIENALKNINPEQGDLILITGSLYLAGEVLNQN
jgi:dihydrofolate synthase/folylpolyglutamate synthase